jgi:preprotein translocase subunit SecA
MSDQEYLDTPQQVLDLAQKLVTTYAEVKATMDKRLKQLQAQGHTFKKRAKIGRNDVCPCGSGKKFKKCHLGHVR